MQRVERGLQIQLQLRLSMFAFNAARTFGASGDFFLFLEILFIWWIFFVGRGDDEEGGVCGNLLCCWRKLEEGKEAGGAE